MSEKSIWTSDSNFRTGETVRVGGNIVAVVEEIIFARGMNHPFYLLQWWQEGRLQSGRFHEDEVMPVEQPPKKELPAPFSRINDFGHI